MKIILTRHCETDWNRERKVQGQTDTELNEKGRTEARQLGEKLRHQQIQRIISSDLKRARTTAEIIGEVLGLGVETDIRLRECSFGVLEGKYRAELDRLLGKDWPADFESYDFVSFGGESRSQVLKRHLELVDDIKKRFPAETVLLVGHGRGIITLLNAFHPGEAFPKGEFRILEL